MITNISQSFKGARVEIAARYIALNIFVFYHDYQDALVVTTDLHRMVSTWMAFG